MTTRVVMVCHGSTDALHRAAFPLDEPLDAQGLRQASEAVPLRGTAAKALAGPSQRCAQTAAALGLTAEPDDGLRECDYGRWAGRTLAQVQAEDPHGVHAWLTDPSAAPHGGESLLALIDRVATWLDSRSAGGGRLLAITHPAVIRAAVVHALDAPPQTFWKVDVEPLSQVNLTLQGPRKQLRFT